MSASIVHWTEEVLLHGGENQVQGFKREFSINSKLISSNNEDKIKFINSFVAGNLLGNNTQREDIVSKVCKMFRLLKNSYY